MKEKTRKNQKKQKKKQQQKEEEEKAKDHGVNNELICVILLNYKYIRTRMRSYRRKNILKYLLKADGIGRFDKATKLLASLSTNKRRMKI
jgi:hypothetical protein